MAGGRSSSGPSWACGLFVAVLAVVGPPREPAGPGRRRGGRATARPRAWRGASASGSSCCSHPLAGRWRSRSACWRATGTASPAAAADERRGIERLEALASGPSRCATPSPARSAWSRRSRPPRPTAAPVLRPSLNLLVDRLRIREPLPDALMALRRRPRRPERRRGLRGRCSSTPGCAAPACATCSPRWPPRPARSSTCGVGSRPAGAHPAQRPDRAAHRPRDDGPAWRCSTGPTSSPTAASPARSCWPSSRAVPRRAAVAARAGAAREGRPLPGARPRRSRRRGERLRSSRSAVMTAALLAGASPASASSPASGSSCGPRPGVATMVARIDAGHRSMQHAHRRRPRSRGAVRGRRARAR